MSGISADPSLILVMDEDLSNYVLETICRIIYVREVLPTEMPLTHIKTFK